MLSIEGTYQNGCVKLDKDYITKSPVKVIVTFLEEVQDDNDERLALSDFSFSKSRENLRNSKESFADAVIDERRSEL